MPAMNKTPSPSRRQDGGRSRKKTDEAAGHRNRGGVERESSSAAVSAKGALDDDLLRKMDAWWRAANYLSVGQTYLYDNPLLKEPLRKEHIKPRLVGHWGTTPGLNFIYVHLNRVIRQHDL